MKLYQWINQIFIKIGKKICKKFNNKIYLKECKFNNDQNISQRWIKCLNLLKNINIKCIKKLIKMFMEHHMINSYKSNCQLQIKHGKNLKLIILWWILKQLTMKHGVITTKMKKIKRLNFHNRIKLWKKIFLLKIYKYKNNKLQKI